MESRRTRQYGRVAQACDNCRRKKVRCPGERPRCSACTRLHQQCSFADKHYMSEQAASSLESRMSDRMVQLEDKLETLISRVAPPSQQHISHQEATPSSSSSRPANLLPFSPSIAHASPLTPTTLPAVLISQAIEFYFLNIHRQPVWLFDQDTLPAPDTCEELICVMLALSVSYNGNDSMDGNLRGPEVYSKAARQGIMMRIADGNMTLQSTQALCLLTYWTLISGDVISAGFDVTLAKNVMQRLAAQDQTHKLGSSHEYEKLFWSISFLHSTWGTPTLVPVIDGDINNPRFSTMQAQHSFTACPRVPQDDRRDPSQGLTNVWSHSMSLSSLWEGIRLYVARCIEGSAGFPWRPDSDYTRLCSRLLEVEFAHPSSLSWNSVKFPSVSPQDVQTYHLDWVPWLRAQFAYHAIHCVLNHPFLYTMMAEKPKNTLGAATFWKSSHAKALKHCTWIARLTRTASEKGLKLSDPFFAQAAVIASTLHLYWTRSRNNELRASSIGNLEICRKLVTDMANYCPICRTMKDALNQFIDLIHPPTVSNNPIPAPVAVERSLLWLLLDVAAPQFPSYTSGGNCQNDAWSIRVADENDSHWSQSEIGTPGGENYALPASWQTAGAVGESAQMGAAGRQPQDTSDPVFQRGSSDRKVTQDVAWGPWEDLLSVEDMLAADNSWFDSNNF